MLRPERDTFVPLWWSFSFQELYARPRLRPSPLESGCTDS